MRAMSRLKSNSSSTDFACEDVRRASSGAHGVQPLRIDLELLEFSTARGALRFTANDRAGVFVLSRVASDEFNDVTFLHSLPAFRSRSAKCASQS